MLDSSMRIIYKVRKNTSKYEIPCAVAMKVTLSYYIEPAPEQKGWNNKYRYASSALRFEVINKNQIKDDFLKRINAEAREDEKKKDKALLVQSVGFWGRIIEMWDLYIQIHGLVWR